MERLIRLNKTRADFAGKFEVLIDTYNANGRNVEELFAELPGWSCRLNQMQQCHIRKA